MLCSAARFQPRRLHSALFPFPPAARRTKKTVFGPYPLHSTPAQPLCPRPLAFLTYFCRLPSHLAACHELDKQLEVVEHRKEGGEKRKAPGDHRASDPLSRQLPGFPIVASPLCEQCGWFSVGANQPSVFFFFSFLHSWRCSLHFVRPITGICQKGLSEMIGP